MRPTEARTTAARDTVALLFFMDAESRFPDLEMRLVSYGRCHCDPHGVSSIMVGEVGFYNIKAEVRCSQGCEWEL